MLKITEIIHSRTLDSQLSRVRNFELLIEFKLLNCITKNRTNETQEITDRGFCSDIFWIGIYFLPLSCLVDL